MLSVASGCLRASIYICTGRRSLQISLRQVLLEGVLAVLLETAFFNAQTIREIEIENRKLGGKKKVSSVFTQYVCLCVCLFVCLFVCLSSLYSLHRLT